MGNKLRDDVIFDRSFLRRICIYLHETNRYLVQEKETHRNKENGTVYSYI